MIFFSFEKRLDRDYLHGRRLVVHAARIQFGDDAFRDSFLFLILKINSGHICIAAVGKLSAWIRRIYMIDEILQELEQSRKRIYKKS